MPVAAHGRTVGSGIAPGIGKAAAALRQVIPWGRVVSDLSGWAAVRRQHNRPLGQFVRVEPLLEALPGHVIHWAGDHHPFGRSAISIWGSLGAACVGYRIGHGRRTACEHNECHDASHETGALQLHPCGWMIHSGTLCPCKLDALIWVKPRRRYAVAVQQCAGECRLQVARPALVSVRPTQQARDRMVRRRHLGAAVAVVAVQTGRLASPVQIAPTHDSTLAKFSATTELTAARPRRKPNAAPRRLCLPAGYHPLPARRRNDSQRIPERPRGACLRASGLMLAQWPS